MPKYFSDIQQLEQINIDLVNWCWHVARRTGLTHRVARETITGAHVLQHKIRQAAGRQTKHKHSAGIHSELRNLSTAAARQSCEQLMFRAELGWISAQDSTQMVKKHNNADLQADWLIPVSLLICNPTYKSTQISIYCTLLPRYATVAAKTKAAWEIISLKSSSKLHPVCPMPAGPGDCAGVLIHLKAEDLCCCFQGAWPMLCACAPLYTLTHVKNKKIKTTQ